MLFGKIPPDLESDVIIFVHIPKTGGWSLIRQIEAIWGEQAHLRLGMSKLEKVHRSRLHLAHSRLKWGLARAREMVSGVSRLAGRRLSEADRKQTRFVSGHFICGHEPDLGKRPVYISLVRDPIDRFVSDYFFSRQAQGEWRRVAGLHDPRKKAAAEMDIDDYTRWLAHSGNGALHNVQCQYISGSPSFAEARKAINGKYYVCAPLVRIDEFTKMFLGEFKIKDVSVNQINKSKLRPERFVISDETKKIVERLFSEDIKLYEYVCEEFEKLRTRFS